MRDKIYNEEYFEKFILEESNRIDKFLTKLCNGEVNSERILPVKAKVHDLQLGILIAKYSKGDSLDLLKQEYISLVEEWDNVFEPEFYNKNLKMISLAVLFNAKDSILKMISTMIKQSNINDWLFDFLLGTLHNGIADSNKELLFPESFTTLKKAVYKKNAVEDLENYLSREWYCEDCGCYEAHKSKQNIYYGYWSFEAGAVAKMLKLNDEKLKQQQFYPYDLVHFND